MFRCDPATLSTVMPALVASIHVFLAAARRARRGWPGRRPAMTPEGWFNAIGMRSSPETYSSANQCFLPRTISVQLSSCSTTSTFVPFLSQMQPFHFTG